MIRTAGILFVLQSEIFNDIQEGDFFDQIIRLKNLFNLKLGDKNNPRPNLKN